MAGHSKWANIKHRKDRADKKKGKIFSRLTKEIISAVKQGGPDQKTNAKLKMAVQKAKSANLPNDNIERNIKKASSADQQDYFEMMYELYGYGGVGILVEALTDNKNRTASEMRIATNKCGGTIATPGAVAYNFQKKGVFRFVKEIEEEKLFELVTELGAEDFEVTEEAFVVLTTVESFLSIEQALQKKGVVAEEAGLEQVPNALVSCSDEDIEKNTKLIEWLEDIDDVDAVFHNMSMG